MHAAELKRRTGCKTSVLKAWVRAGVVVPRVGAQGSGNHSEYDEANVIALSLALKMGELHVVVAKYSTAFEQLQAWLRSHSVIEWSRFRVTMLPHAVTLFRTDMVPNPSLFVTGFSADLGECMLNPYASSPDAQMQLPFALRSA